MVSFIYRIQKTIEEKTERVETPPVTRASLLNMYNENVGATHNDFLKAIILRHHEKCSGVLIDPSDYMLRLIKKDGEGEIISHLPEIEAGEFENFLIDNGQPTTVNCISLTLLMVSNQYTVNRNDQMKQMQDAFSQMFEAQAKLMLEIK